MKIEVELWVENFGQEMREIGRQWISITQLPKGTKPKSPMDPRHGHYRWLGLILYQSQEPMYWRVFL